MTLYNPYFCAIQGNKTAFKPKGLNPYLDVEKLLFSSFGNFEDKNNTQN